MGKRGSGVAGALSRSVAAALTRLRHDRGWDNQTLFSAADLSESYYYVRMRGDQPFTLNDVERLADALGVHFLEIFRLAALENASSEEHPLPGIQANPAEFSSRLRRLVEGLRSNGTEYRWEDLARFAETEGIPLTAEQFKALEQGAIARDLSPRAPLLLSRYWEVPEPYFSDFEDADAYDMTDALLDFRQAMKETGAVSIAARALTDITPSGLRAITRTLRSIGG